jgi:hypothetical protein
LGSAAAKQRLTPAAQALKDDAARMKQTEAKHEKVLYEVAQVSGWGLRA